MIDSARLGTRSGALRRFAAYAAPLPVVVALCLFLPACSGEPLPELPAPVPIVERLDDDVLLIRWDHAPVGEAIPIYSGPTPDAIDRSSQVAELVDGRARVAGHPVTQRVYFELVPAGDARSRIAGERVIPLEGSHNTRDLGGYETRDGRFVRWGRLIRSDHLGDLSDRDLEVLSSLGIETVCDFRSKPELEEDPDRLPAISPPRHVNPAIAVEGANPALIREVITSGNEEEIDFSQFLVDANIEFVRSAGSQYREFFRLLEDPEQTPILFHCTAGKDRAGFGAAMTLMVLGVPESTVMEDYLLTEITAAEHIRHTLLLIRFGSFFRTDPDEIAPLLGVRREFLQAALDTIEKDHGSVDAYLRDGLGVTDAARADLQARFLR